MPYYSQADVCRLMAERYDTKSNVKLDGFQSQLETSCVSSHIDELWYNEIVCLQMTIYIYIYIYICVCVCVCVRDQQKTLWPESILQTNEYATQTVHIKYIIMIIILSCYQHRSPWVSLTTRLYRPSLPEGLQGYILYRHKAVVYRF